MVIDCDIDKDKGIEGYHLFYKSDDKYKCTTGLYEGIDIRAEGGYIVAPPSIHPNGRAYEWEFPPDNYPLCDVDDVVSAFLSKKGEKATYQNLLQLPEVINEGGQNDAMYRLACSLRAKGLSEQGIIEAVRDENIAKCAPPLEDEELQNIIKSSFRHESGTAPYNKADNKSNVAHNTSIKPLVEWEEKAPEWLISDYFPRYEINIIGAAGGTGKSTLYAHIAACISKGDYTIFENDLKIFGLRNDPGRVLIFSGEDSYLIHQRQGLGRTGQI